MLLIVSLLQFSMTALSGDENDPEIIDELSKIYDEVRKPPVQEIKEKCDRLTELLNLRGKEEEENKPGVVNDTKKKDKENDTKKTGT